MIVEKNLRARLDKLHRKRTAARRPGLWIALAAATGLLAGCGTAAESQDSLRPVQGQAAAAQPAPVAPRPTSAPRLSCATTAMSVFGQVAMRVYGEALHSNTTAAALRMVGTSSALRAAVARHDAARAQAAVSALIATGHMVRVRVSAGGRVLVDQGSRTALGRVGGKLAATARAHASFAVSVQDASGLLGATQGLTGTTMIIRSGRQVLAAHSTRVPAHLPLSGRVRVDGHAEEVFSFRTRTFDGRPARAWVLRPVSTTASICGRTPAETRALAVAYIGLHIYGEEIGGTAQRQLRRAEGSAALVSAVRAGEANATRQAIVALLNHHIVRIRALRAGRLLADVGGPHVLAPVSGTLRSPDGVVGQIVLSVQDDLGYLLLAHRLIGVEVLMRDEHGQVMGTLSPGPSAVPDLGPVTWRGHRYEAFSFRASEFPSGPLRISLLIPLR